MDAATERAIAHLRAGGPVIVSDADAARIIAELDRLRAMERRMHDLALNEPGPRGTWAAQVLAIRAGESGAPTAPDCTPRT